MLRSVTLSFLLATGFTVWGGGAFAQSAGMSRPTAYSFGFKGLDGKLVRLAEYAGKPRDALIYQREFVPAFDGWRERAAAVGVEIVNCTPDSAVTEFPFVPLDEVLSCARS